MPTEPLYIGIDVGTGSARAAIFSKSGTLLASSTKDTQTWRVDSDHRIFEQSTSDIWNAICFCVRQVMQNSGAQKEDVKGIGFDATCSLAVIDYDDNPVCITDGDKCGGLGERNIILWADHRAEEEADLINRTGSIVLDYVGGTMSLEMEIPKILWLKKNMSPSQFQRCQFFDLPDFLTYRATSSTQRSSCSLVCKCSYLPQTGWQADFFHRIGLSELVHSRYKQVGAGEILTAGQPVGKGLTTIAASELGLPEGTPVGSAVIDAYAGWLGTAAARYYETGNSDPSPASSLDASRHRLAAVAGTSTCHLVQNPHSIFVPGVWGPYRDAVFPGWWMSEGGQSSTGQLIDFIITTHPAYVKLEACAAEDSISIHEWLERELLRQQKEFGVNSRTELTKDLHIYPDLHGNRSPIADSKMRGSIMGLTLDDGLGDLARKFNATLEAIALQTRHIVDEMNGHGHSIKEISMSGGQVKNSALMQLIANVCRIPVIIPSSPTVPVILGSAILGRNAAEQITVANPNSERLWDIMVQMTPPGIIIRPSNDKTEHRLLEAKYKVFRECIDVQKRWRQDMQIALTGRVEA